MAVQNSDIESVLFLISVQANVNSRVQDASKLTPLHLAVQAGSEIIVRNLVSHKCMKQACLRVYAEVVLEAVVNGSLGMKPVRPRRQVRSGGNRRRDRESGLAGPGGFDRQQKGAAGQLCCLPTLRHSAETFPPSPLPSFPFCIFSWNSMQIKLASE